MPEVTPMTPGPIALSLEVAADAVVERLPLLAQVVGGDRPHHAGARVGQRAADVGPRVLEQQLLVAAGEVDGVQGDGVAVARLAQVHGLAVGGDVAEVGAQRVVERDLLERLPAALAVGQKDVDAAVLARARGQAHLQLGVGDVAGELLIVALDEGPLAGREIDAVEVVPLLIAVVHADEHDVGVEVADAVDAGARLRIGREVAALAGLEVERVEMEVLVAAGVAHVEQGVGAVGPEVLGDAPRLVGGDRATLARVVGRRDVDVEHAVDRGDPAEVLAVGADLHVHALGVAEQQLARDELGLRRGGRGERRRGGGLGRRRSGLPGVGRRRRIQAGATARPRDRSRNRRIRVLQGRLFGRGFGIRGWRVGFTRWVKSGESAGGTARRMAGADDLSRAAAAKTGVPAGMGIVFRGPKKTPRPITLPPIGGRLSPSRRRR
ncbi:hypothetical protein OV079_17635 [Nannocystis pusilla]|uniref:Uncharacterized protein n=1 Tax=Nannocystis pusilla TaxID=889268 RepID=A0A9X3EP62_9BACT|nr:hypothetical protein [Nannocystis pusilla]MCY1007340.1 hypothetical protein [Nannocystis pusilla]